MTRKIFKDVHKSYRCTKNKPKYVMRFEKHFYGQFNQQLAKHGPQYFEQARIKYLRIQSGILFKNCPDLHKMKWGLKCRNYHKKFETLVFDKNGRLNIFLNFKPH